MTDDELIDLATRMLGGDRAEAVELVKSRNHVSDTFNKLLVEHSRLSDSKEHDSTNCPLTTDVALKAHYPFVKTIDLEVACHFVGSIMLNGFFKRQGLRLHDNAIADMVGNFEDMLRATLWLLDALNKEQVKGSEMPNA